MSARLRFRHNVAVPVAGFAAIVMLIPLAGSRWYLTPLLLFPAAVMVWGWRSGVDVDPDGLTVRALFGSRRLPWREITGFRARGRRVSAVLDGDRTVPLPVVTPGDMPRLIEAGRQELTEREPAREPEREPEQHKPERKPQQQPEQQPGQEPDGAGQ